MPSYYLNLEEKYLIVTYNNWVDCKGRDICNYLGFNMDSTLNTGPVIYI